MTTIKQMTRDEFVAFVQDGYEDDAQTVLAQVDVWLRRGDGVAVYRNHDMSSIDLGGVRMVSYGSPAAQLEVDDPPTQLPDIGGHIGWRYQLEATYREQAS